MSASASAPAEEPQPVSELGDMAAECEDMIDAIDDKLENGRIRDPERERVRQGWRRLKLKAIDQWLELKKERDLEQMQADIETLKAGRGGPD